VKIAKSKIKERTINPKNASWLRANKAMNRVIFLSADLASFG